MARNWDISTFTTALRTSTAGLAVGEATVRNYRMGRAPFVLRLLLAHPHLIDALKSDARRMAPKDRSALVAELRKGK